MLFVTNMIAILVMGAQLAASLSESLDRTMHVDVRLIVEERLTSATDE